MSCNIIFNAATIDKYTPTDKNTCNYPDTALSRALFISMYVFSCVWGTDSLEKYITFILTASDIIRRFMPINIYNKYVKIKH